MISKVITGGHFKACCRYVCEDKSRSEILFANGVREQTYHLMAWDFEAIQKLKPNKKKAVFHGILSFYPGEKLSNEKMVEIGRRYLEELNIINTQFVIAKHFDKEHSHMHIIANLVNQNGESISENWIGLRGKKVAQKLTQEYGLIPATRKDLKSTNLKQLSKEDLTRYQIFYAMDQLLPKCDNLKELFRKLELNKIQTRYKFKKGTTEIQGISFERNRLAFKASEVDRKFSYGNLQKYFVQKERENLQESQTEKYSYKIRM